MTQIPEKTDINKLLGGRAFLLPGRPAKEAVLAHLTRAVCAADARLDEPGVLAQILQREQGLGTTLETGLNIPHARLEELDEFKAALAVLPGGMRDACGKDLPVKAVFLFLSPGRPAYFQAHLRLLASLAQTFTPAFLEDLLHCADSDGLRSELEAKIK